MKSEGLIVSIHFNHLHMNPVLTTMQCESCSVIIRILTYNFYFIRKVDNHITRLE